MDFEKFNPNESVYHISTYICDKLLEIGKFCGYAQINGLENINEKNYLIFASNHQSFLDIVLLESILIKYSTNKKVIPAPTYRGFFNGLKRKWVAPILLYYGGFPIYPRKEGPALRKRSIDESVHSLLQQDRLIIFPEGKRNLDGKVGKGKLGIADIAIGTYNLIKETEKKEIDIIPTAIYYKPMPGIPFINTKKITVSFGKSIPFSNLLTCDLSGKEPCSKIEEGENCINCRIKITNSITDEIRKLTTVNMEQLVSYFLIDAAQNNKLFTKEQMTDCLRGISNHLKKKGITLDYAVEHFFEKRMKSIMDTAENNGFLAKVGEKYKANQETFLYVPPASKTRNKNPFMYYKNSIEHLLTDFENPPNDNS